MLGSMVSGIVISHHALTFLPVTGGQSWARLLHMLSAYWECESRVEIASKESSSNSAEDMDK